MCGGKLTYVIWGPGTRMQMRSARPELLLFRNDPTRFESYILCNKCTLVIRDLVWSRRALWDRSDKPEIAGGEEVT